MKNLDNIDEKLADAMIPGAEIEFLPDEAEQVGAFVEDAISLTDAREGVLDMEYME